MSAGVTAQPQQQLDFWAVLVGIVRSLRSKKKVALTAREQALIDVFRRGGEAFAPGLLASTSRLDLAERLDVLVGSEEFWVWRAQLIGLITPEVLTEIVETELDVHELSDGFGASEVLERGARYAAAVVVAASQLVNAIGHVPVTQGSDLVEVIADAELPVEAGSVLVDAFKAEAAMLVVFKCKLDGTRLEPWLALAIAETWEHGVREQLRLLASFPTLDVPETLIGISERFDLDTIGRRNFVARLLRDQWAANAATIGSGRGRERT